MNFILQYLILLHLIEIVQAEGFTKGCAEGTCVCEGYPNGNVKEALLKGSVSLAACAEACGLRKLCFGFEYWSDRKESENCFECGINPSLKSTVNIRVIGNMFNTVIDMWATVHVKNLNEFPSLINYVEHTKSLRSTGKNC